MGVLEYTDGILRHKVNSLLPGCETNQLLFFLSQLVTHRLHGEVNFYPKISVLVNIQFPENSLSRHASKSGLSPLEQLISNLLPQINFLSFQE